MAANLVRLLAAMRGVKTRSEQSHPPFCMNLLMRVGWRFSCYSVRVRSCGGSAFELSFCRPKDFPTSESHGDRFAPEEGSLPEGLAYGVLRTSRLGTVRSMDHHHYSRASNSALARHSATLELIVEFFYECYGIVHTRAAVSGSLGQVHGECRESLSALPFRVRCPTVLLLFSFLLAFQAHPPPVAGPLMPRNWHTMPLVYC